MRAAAPMLALLLVAGPAACRPDPATPRGAAEIFLDAYYVHIDLAAARDATSGVARQKIEHELELVEGQHIDAGTRKPSVHYRLLEERPDGDQAVSYVYRGTISVEDADRFERRWLVTVRREDGRWRVTNFQETGG